MIDSEHRVGVDLFVTLDRWHLGSSEVRFDSCYQLVLGKWLDDVIVGADLKTFYPVILRAESSKEYDRDIGHLPDSFTELESVHPRRFQVEQRQIGPRCEERLQGLFATFSRDRLVSR